MTAPRSEHPVQQDAGASPRRAGEEYPSRLAQRRESAETLAKRADTLGNARLGVFLAGAVVAYLVIWPRVMSAWWLVVPAAAFLALAVHHESVLRVRDRARRAAAFYEAGLRRLDDTWAGSGNPGARFASDGAHPYAPDLDLFGRGSLFELLCIARTRPGEETLAAWLTGPAPSVEEIGARQAAVAELAPRLDLREDVAVLGEEVRTGKGRPARTAGVDGDALTAWAEAPASLPPPSWALHSLAAFPALLALAFGALWLFWEANPLFFVAAVLSGQLLAWRIAGGAGATLSGVDKAARDLELLASLLARVERERFEAPRLRAVADALTPTEGGAQAPSAAVRRLGVLLDAVDAPRNPFFAPLAFVLLWRVQCAFLVEGWRRHNGPRVRDWLAATGEFEALSSLAGFAYENPDDPFPEVAPDGEPPVFSAEGLAHPLLPPSSAVRNNVALGGGEAPRLLLLSGSNMSGKSTLLRAIGTNTVLALAGAPVRARRLRVSRLAIGASLRTQDSLQGGVSRFLAEVRRLRQVAEIGEAGALPLLFLLDEILSGTNSHDRRIGAEALARALLTKGRGDAVGLITTHDLALTEMAADPALRAANVHLEDRIEGGVIAFDYTLRPGVVTKSNALALMRAAGLDV